MEGHDEEVQRGGKYGHSFRVQGILRSLSVKDGSTWDYSCGIDIAQPANQLCVNSSRLKRTLLFQCRIQCRAAQHRNYSATRGGTIPDEAHVGDTYRVCCAKQSLFPGLRVFCHWVHEIRLSDYRP